MNHFRTEQRPAPGTPTPPTSRRPYRTPRLETLGDLRSLTLGGSPGMGDSANTAIESPLGF